ncbi:MAG: hypothetical protein ACTSRE_08975, partial [Promethearchaeota archaeon]
MNILMVVTDIFLQDFSGGARRTIETARVLSKLGHHVTIFCNRRINDRHYEKMGNLTIYRVHML